MGRDRFDKHRERMPLNSLPRLVNPRVQLGALPSKALSKQEAKGRQGPGNS